MLFSDNKCILNTIEQQGSLYYRLRGRYDLRPINNGQDCEKTGISVSDYLEQENYNVKHIVVEYNLEIIPKERYAQTILKDGDEVEIVSFMGGGSK